MEQPTPTPHNSETVSLPPQTEISEFQLSHPFSVSAHVEQSVLALLEHTDTDHSKAPLACVTFKTPFHEYARLKAVSLNWRIPYTELLRAFCSQIVPVLECPPTGPVLDWLVRHREEEEEKDRAREEKKLRRFGELNVPPPANIF